MPKNVKSRTVTAKSATKWNAKPSRKQQKAGGGVKEKVNKPHYWYRNRKKPLLKMRKLGLKKNRGKNGKR